jgi:hypothetical protein
MSSSTGSAMLSASLKKARHPQIGCLLGLTSEQALAQQRVFLLQDGRRGPY